MLMVTKNDHCLVVVYKGIPKILNRRQAQEKQLKLKLSHGKWAVIRVDCR